MRKLIGFLIALGMVASVQAANIWGNDNVRLHYSLSNVTASTQHVLLDLSDTSSYGHQHAGFFEITGVSVAIDMAASAAGTVKLGVANYVGASTGSVTYFFECPFVNHGATATIVQCGEAFDLNPIRAKVATASTADTDGSTPYIVGTSSSALEAIDYNTQLTTSAGSDAAPRAGDIILTVTRSDSARADIIIDVNYNSRR